MEPKTKTLIIRAHMEAGDWRRAIASAAKLPLRGDKRREAILDAHGAYTNARFYTQIGKDTEALIAAGKAALIDRFGI